MSNPRTEKAALKAMEAIRNRSLTMWSPERTFNIEKGDCTFRFYDGKTEKLIASFSLSQLIAKRGPKRKAKKGGKS